MVSDLILFLPEAVLCLGALAAFICMVAQGRPVWSWGAALIAALAALVTAAATVYLSGEPHMSGEPFFPGIYRVDLFSQLIKLGLSLGLLLVLLSEREFHTVRQDARSDLPLFFLVGTIGLMMLSSATELLTLYVALELSAYAMYVGVALHSGRQAGPEASAKYVLFGAAASAVTLYGISLIFGTTGTTYLPQIAQSLQTGEGGPLLLVGLVLLLAALLFKLALAPFHHWAPDAYEQGPHAVVNFVATTSKLGAVAILARMWSLLSWSPGRIAELTLALAILSMTLGNLSAIGQRDLKRLLAYSAVAHAGYLFLGYGAMSTLGLASVIFYGFAYLVITQLAFVVICSLGRDGRNPELSDLAGLHHRAPGAALMLLVSMFGLAGLPPTAGFIGKWYLFAAALERGYFTLVLIAALNGTIALYYYLKVVRYAYLVPATDKQPISLGPAGWLAGAAALLLTLFLGIYPEPLWSLAERAAATLLHL